MANENLVHLKFEYSEALQSKKDLLYVEKSSMISAGIIEKLVFLKSKKSKKELDLYKKIRSLITSVRKIQKNIPEVDPPKGPHKKISKEVIRKKGKYDNSVESQLQEIQRKLNAMQK